MPRVSLSHFMLLTALISCAPVTSFAQEKEKIPIPPRRPSVLRASEAYIDELRNRALNQGREENEATPDPLSEIYDAPARTSHEEDISLFGNEDALLDNIMTPSTDEIVEALEDKPAKKKDSIKKAPVPIEKPVKIVKANLAPAIIEPAAGEDDDSDEGPLLPVSKNKEGSSKLISFFLQPAQTKLDENLSSFLQNHALKIMTEDKDLDIEIYSYATPIKDEEHSDVRISLARALEVRSFLMNNRIDPSRLRLKPMDNSYDKTKADDRIDLMFIKRQ